MPQELLVAITNSIEAVAEANEGIEAWLATNHADQRLSYLVSLTVEEIAVNCIHYGYRDCEQHEILVHLSLAEEGFTMVMSDDGEAYNTLEAPPPDLGVKIEDRRIGGLGIHLLRTMWDQISYSRVDGRNRLVFEKRLANER